MEFLLLRQSEKEGERSQRSYEKMLHSYPKFIFIYLYIYIFIYLRKLFA